MSSYIYNMTDTWNSAGTTFNSIKMNVTDTASASDSKLIDLQISGISKFNVNKQGGANIGGTISLGSDYIEKMYTASGSNFTIDLSNGTIQKLTTTNTATITLPASASGKSFMIIVVYGGAHAITFTGGSNLKWAGGLAPTATSATGKIDIFTFFCDGTNTYGGVFGQNF